MVTSCDIIVSPETKYLSQKITEVTHWAYYKATLVTCQYQKATLVTFLRNQQKRGVILVFFARLKKLCDDRGISPYKACTDVGLNRAAVAKWKKGSRPNGATAVKLADYFGVSTDYLLGIDDETLMYEKAKSGLDVMTINNPTMSSGAKLSYFIEASDITPDILCHNLEIDPRYLYGWISSNDIPPKPVVDRVLNSLELHPSQVFNGAEYVSYVLEAKEWGDVPAQEIPPFVEGNSPKIRALNTVLIAGRDGSFVQRQLTDEQKQLLTGMLEQMPDASGDL